MAAPAIVKPHAPHGNTRTDEAAAMKRADVWLGTTLGIAAGFFAGFLVANSFTDDGTATSGLAAADGRRIEATPASANVDAVQGGEGATVEAAPGAEASGPTGTREERMLKAVAEALGAAAPYDLGRMLQLVETMKKEDFPIVLDILRKRPNGLGAAVMPDQGPAFWVAFWRRFGQMDPDTAMAKALECGDLQYPRRDLLEKQLFYGMARTNAPGAAAKLLAHPELPNPLSAIAGLMWHWGNHDLQAASAWAQQHLQGDGLDRALYAASWSVMDVKDISRGVALLKMQPEGPMREAVRKSLRDQARQMQAMPASQLLTLMGAIRETGARDPQFEGQLLGRCVASDAFATAEFFAQPLPDGTSASELQGVLSAWITKDAKAAEAWAKGYEGKPVHEVYKAAAER